MQITPQERWKKFDSLPQAEQELYSGIETGRGLRKIFESYHMREASYDQYAELFGDVVLGFEAEQNLAKLFTERMGLSEKVAPLVAHDLLELINTHKMQTAGKKSGASTPSAQPAPAAVSVPNPTLAEQEGPASWSRRIAPAPAFGEAAPPHDVHADTPVAPPSPTIPQYKKPLTDIPRYVADPYREPPK